MISVIVPVYNVKQYLLRCVESLLHQDIQEPYEIILVDDGSTDGSGAMCDELQAQHPDIIHVLHKKNGGLSDARNHGLQLARGEWISYVDSDDYVSPGYLSVLYNMVQKFDADMSVITIEKTREGAECKTWKKRFNDFALDKKAAFFEMYVRQVFGWYVPGKLYKKSIVEKHPFPDGYYEDSATQYLLIDECKLIAFGDYMDQYKYILRDGSITASRLNQKHFRVFEVCNEIKEWLEERYPEWQYISVLMYQNAVLQLINRTVMDDTSFKRVFTEYRSLFRRELWRILRQRGIPVAVKYYSFVLCLTPAFYRFQRKWMLQLIGERV